MLCITRHSQFHLTGHASIHYPADIRTLTQEQDPGRGCARGEHGTLPHQRGQPPTVSHIILHPLMDTATEHRVPRLSY